MESKAESRPWSGHGSLLTQEIKKGYTSPVRRSHQHPTHHQRDTYPDEAASSWKEGFNSVNFNYMDEVSKTFPQAQAYFFEDNRSESGGGEESDEDKKELDITFQPESSWKLDTKCFVCSRVFDQLQGVFRHHCRVCANSVCGECSSKRIKKKRYCDVCRFKIHNAKTEEMRALTLKHYDEKIQKKQEEIKKLKEQIAEEKHKILQFKEDVEKDEEHMMKSLRNFETEYERLMTMLPTTKENNQRLKAVLKEKQETLLEKQQQFTNLTLKIKQLGLEIINKKTTHMLKIEEFSKLQGIKNGEKNNDAGNSFDNAVSMTSVNQDSYQENSFFQDKGRALSASDFGSLYELRKPSFINDIKENPQPQQTTGSFIEPSVQKKGLCSCKCGFD